MARGQMPSLTSVGVMPNVSSTVLGSRPESHCHRLQIGLLHRLEPPRVHVKHMFSPPCGMVSGNFPATSDKPLHCQEPSPIMTPSCRGDDLLFAFDVIACCYLVFIGMTRNRSRPNRFARHRRRWVPVAKGSKRILVATSWIASTRPCLLVLRLLLQEQHPLRDLDEMARGLLLLPLVAAAPERHPQSPHPLLDLVARGPNHVPYLLNVHHYF